MEITHSDVSYVKGVNSDVYDCGARVPLLFHGLVLGLSFWVKLSICKIAALTCISDVLVLDFFWVFTAIVHKKMEILAGFTQAHVVLNSIPYNGM